MKEIWKDVKSFSNYQISNLGRIKSKARETIDKNGVKKIKKEKILKQHLDKDGYFVIGLYDENTKHYNKRINVLVAEAFILNPNNYSCVNHKNEIKTDNRVENLEWCSVKYNNNYGTVKERKRNKMIEKCKNRNYNGGNNPNAKLSNNDRIQIKSMKGKYTIKELAYKYNVNITTIYNVLKG